MMENNLNYYQDHINTVFVKFGKPISGTWKYIFITMERLQPGGRWQVEIHFFAMKKVAAGMY